MGGKGRAAARLNRASDLDGPSISAVKTGASADSVCVQMQLTAEAEGGRVRRRHLLMDVEAFYDLYEKIEKGVASVKEILRA